MANCSDRELYSIQKLKNLEQNIQNLLREAVEARLASYAPYSKFQVGAAVLCEDGTIFRGCNIENASFPVSHCAEKTALGTAICSGKRKFKAIAVIANQQNKFTPPCGSCRQFMGEFGQFELYIAKPDLSEIVVTNLKKILPFSFEAENYTF